jgi:Ribosomal RNA-processing protein 7 (RRP7) C-terminal domain
MRTTTAGSAQHHDAMQVVAHPKQTSAIVQFVDRSGRDAALAAGRECAVIEFPLDVDDAAGPWGGLRKWVEEHKAQYPGNAVLQKQLDEWMANFEDEEERRRKEAEQAAADDGWTVVTKRAGRKRKHGACLCMIAMHCCHQRRDNTCAQSCCSSAFSEHASDMRVLAQATR